MIYYSNYYGHLFNNTGKRKLYDDTIYTFDIETTSYFILDDVVHESIDYLMLTQKEKDRCIKQSNMYIWMFGINGSVYYGRTWEEFKEFLEMIEHNNPDGLKFIYVHNLSFEFQFLKGLFTFENVMARKMRKVIRAKMKKYNVEFRCTYYIANAALEELPKLFQLDVKKLTGNLDYSKLRNSKTELSEDELSYCENDILVLYEYIKKELVTYEEQKQIPNTSTGKVRRELKKKLKRIITIKIKFDPVLMWILIYLIYFKMLLWVDIRMQIIAILMRY